jgi:hypothetical protein
MDGASEGLADGLVLKEGLDEGSALGSVEIDGEALG